MRLTVMKYDPEIDLGDRLLNGQLGNMTKLAREIMDTLNKRGPIRLSELYVSLKSWQEAAIRDVCMQLMDRGNIGVW